MWWILGLVITMLGLVHLAFFRSQGKSKRSLSRKYDGKNPANPEADLPCPELELVYAPQNVQSIIKQTNPSFIKAKKSRKKRKPELNDSAFNTKSAFSGYRTVFLDDLVPTHFGVKAPKKTNTKIRLTIIEEGMCCVSFMTTVVDDRGRASPIAFYNCPGSGKVGLIADITTHDQKGQHFFKPGVRILLRNPWYKERMSGSVGLRVEDPKDVVILKPHGGGACYHCDMEAPEGGRLLRCGRCRAVFYCSSACQALSWPIHRHFCTTAAENSAAYADELAESAAE